MTPVARPAKDWAEEYRKYARAYEVLYAAQQGEAQRKQQEAMRQGPHGQQTALSDLMERGEETGPDSGERSPVQIPSPRSTAGEDAHLERESQNRSSAVEEPMRPNMLLRASENGTALLQPDLPVIASYASAEDSGPMLSSPQSRDGPQAVTAEAGRLQAQSEAVLPTTEQAQAQALGAPHQHHFQVDVNKPGLKKLSSHVVTLDKNQRGESLKSTQDRLTLIASLQTGNWFNAANSAHRDSTPTVDAASFAASYRNGGPGPSHSGSGPFNPFLAVQQVSAHWQKNFLKYDERDFKSYLKYLTADGHYFDRRFLSRLDDQAGLLKLITQQSNKDSLGYDIGQQAEHISRDQRLAALTQKRAQEEGTTPEQHLKITLLKRHLHDLVVSRKENETTIGTTINTSARRRSLSPGTDRLSAVTEHRGRKRGQAYTTVPSKLLQFGGAVTQPASPKDADSPAEHHLYRQAARDSHVQKIVVDYNNRASQASQRTYNTSSVLKSQRSQNPSKQHATPTFTDRTRQATLRKATFTPDQMAQDRGLSGAIEAELGGDQPARTLADATDYAEPAFARTFIGRLGSQRVTKPVAVEAVLAPRNALAKVHSNQTLARSSIAGPDLPPHKSRDQPPPDKRYIPLGQNIHVPDQSCDGDNQELSDAEFQRRLALQQAALMQQQWNLQRGQHLHHFRRMRQLQVQAQQLTEQNSHILQQNLAVGQEQRATPQPGGNGEAAEDVSNCDIQTEMIESWTRHPTRERPAGEPQYYHQPPAQTTKLLLGNKSNKLQTRVLEVDQESTLKAREADGAAGGRPSSLKKTSYDPRPARSSNMNIEITTNRIVSSNPDLELDSRRVGTPRNQDQDPRPAYAAIRPTSHPGLVPGSTKSSKGEKARHLMTPIDISFTDGAPDEQLESAISPSVKAGGASRNTKKAATQSHPTPAGGLTKPSPPHGRSEKPEIFKMPECLKELVDYKNSEDFQLFKQLHKSLRQNQKKGLMPRAGSRPHTGGNAGSVFGRRRTQYKPLSSTQNPSQGGQAGLTPQCPTQVTSADLLTGQTSSQGRAKTASRAQCVPLRPAFQIHTQNLLYPDDTHAQQVAQRKASDRKPERQTVERANGAAPNQLTSSKDKRPWSTVNRARKPSTGTVASSDGRAFSAQPARLPSGRNPDPVEGAGQFLASHLRIAGPPTFSQGSLLQQDSQNVVTLGFPPSDKGRTKYMPLSKMHRQRTQAARENSVRGPPSWSQPRRHRSGTSRPLSGTDRFLTAGATKLSKAGGAYGQDAAPAQASHRNNPHAALTTYVTVTTAPALHPRFELAAPQGTSDRHDLQSRIDSEIETSKLILSQ